MWWRTLTVFCVIALSSCDDSEWREVKTPQGVVRGRKDPDGGLYVFYGIPYATTPMGLDRYKAPLPPPAWLQPFEAINKNIICPQTATPFIDINSQRMQEDCLIANVFVPDTDEKNLPVLVYVHGGGFEIGYGNMVSPKRLAKEKKLVIVNFNYRLGAHGFLCLGTTSAPGNAGLKDQVALLRWVKKNIASYGGNPDDVTIAGGSAGSISVDLLSLSKSAQGLFNKVIPESGVSVAAISVQLDPLENARDYAKKLNLSDADDFHALENFYLNTPLDSLTRSTFFERKDSSIYFSACVERKGDKQAFLTDSPINIIKSGDFQKLPLLVGFSNMEGLVFASQLETWKKGMNEKFSDFLPADLKFENEEEKQEIGEKVKQFYFGDKPVGEETVLAFVDYFSDVIFTYPTMRSVKMRVEAGQDQIYLYEYNFVDNSSAIVPHTNVRGATHCAQTMAVLDGSSIEITDESTISEEYKQMKSVMRDLWYNFCVHGKPVPAGSSLPTWTAVGADGGPYMYLSLPIELRNNLVKERVDFWEDIYQKYYRHPIAPSPPMERHADL